MNKCLQDVREARENRVTLFHSFNPNIGMTSPKSLKKFLSGPVANL